MILDDRLLKQQWIQELPNDDFRMLLYLFASASKCGIVELNMRMLNFIANTGRMYSKEDILDRFGNLLCLLPNHENTAIFPDWINRNWTKGRSISGSTSPLFKSLENELASFGLDIDSVNSLLIKMKKGNKNENSKSSDIGDKEQDKPCEIMVGESSTRNQGLYASCITSGKHNHNGDTLHDDNSGTHRIEQEEIIHTHSESIECMFNVFWKEYPSNCPRKVDKKKCRDKFARIFAKCKDKEETFDRIIEGLRKWISCDLWSKDNGQYIMSPLRWLNGENWNDDPMECANNENNRGISRGTTSNYESPDVSGAF